METTATDRGTLAGQLVGVLETGEGAGDLFTASSLFDVNVPGWRFQVQDAGSFVAWWHQEVEGKGRVGRTRYEETANGFVLETEIEFAHHGEDLYARQIFLCEVAGDRIGDLVLYCTGDWDAETRARHAAEAPMIRV